jgi:hypothetical protein
MNDNNLATERFCIWEEKNSIGPLTNCESKNELETNDIISSTEEKLENETSNDITKKWARKCPKCGKMLEYSNKGNLNKAVRKNQLCYSCVRTGMKLPSYTSERSKKISEANHKRKLSEETKKKIGDANRGRKRSDETKRKMSEAIRKPFTEEHRKKLSDCQKGKSHSSERVKNMRIGVIRHIKNNSGISTRYNVRACKYFDELNKKNGWHLIHALNSENGKEYHVAELGYFLDAYDKEKNIVVEYDEKRHNQPNNKRKDLIRQNEIIKHLGCKFYRFNEVTGQLNIFPLSHPEKVNSTR